MCGKHNVRASAGDSTEQNIDEGHTPNLRIGIIIPDPPGIEPGPPGWKAGTLPTTQRLQICNNFSSLFKIIYLS